MFTVAPRYSRTSSFRPTHMGKHRMDPARYSRILHLARLGSAFANRRFAPPHSEGRPRQQAEDADRRPVA